MHHFDCTQFSNYFSFSRTDTCTPFMVNIPGLMTCTLLTVYGKHSRINDMYASYSLW